MRQSFRLFTLHGVEVHSHFSFPFVLLWAAWQGALGGRGLLGAAYGVVSVTLLFASVVLHEMAHSLAARKLGLPVRRITLFPLGGVAELGLLPEKPLQEFVIALAGPLVNFVAALGLGAMAVIWAIASGDARSAVAVAIAAPSLPGLLLYLVAANASLAVFNLIPAFPMDGGRMLRAALATFLDVLVATRIAAVAGHLIAGGLIVAGLTAVALGVMRWSAGFGLALVGLLVIVGAAYEEFWLRRRILLSKIPARSAVQTPTWTVAPGDVVSPLLAVHSFATQPALPVVVGRRVVGLILEKDLRSALTRPERLTIAHIMRADFPRVRVTDSLWLAHELLVSYSFPALPVVDNGRLEGLITRAGLRRAGGRQPRRDDGASRADQPQTSDAPDVRLISY